MRKRLLRSSEKHLFHHGFSLMSNLLQQTADSLSLKSKAFFAYALTILLTLLAAVGVLYEGEFTLLLLALLIFTQTAVLFFFHHYVIQPLARVHAAAQKMTDGHLDSLIRIGRQDEIDRLGESINDLAVNMQEILLFIWNHSRQNQELLEQTAAWLDKPEPLPAIQNDLEEMQRNNEELKAIVLSFSYFEIRLEHERMLAESDCGQDGQCCNGGAACEMAASKGPQDF
jgi:methyl-accepting chemotaxis protein